MIRIKFKKLDPNTIIPSKAFSTDAGMDVIATSKEWLEDLKCWQYGLGFATEISCDYKGIIVPRSSISKYDLIMCNSPAQIDSTYRGEWMVRFKEVKHLGKGIISDSFHGPKTYEIGDRVAQIYFEPIYISEFIEVESLESSERSTGGFGSTGK